MQPSSTIALQDMLYKLQVISSVTHDDKVYVAGYAKAMCKGGKDKSSQVQVFYLAEGVWSTLPEAPNFNANIAIIHGHITQIGGRDAKAEITNVVYAWFEDESKWKEIVRPMPIKRLASGVCHNDGLLLVTGGVVDGTQGEKGKKEDPTVVKTVDVYNFSTRLWSTSKALELPKALRSHHVVVCEENVYLMGGVTTYPAQPEGKEGQFNPQAWTARWSDIKEAVKQPSKSVKSLWVPIAAPPFLRPAVISYRNSLFSIGGVKRGMPQKAIYEFVKVDNHWKEVGNMSVGKYCHGVVPIRSRGVALFVAGGYVQGNPKVDETNVKSPSVELVLL